MNKRLSTLLLVLALPIVGACGGPDGTPEARPAVDVTPSGAVGTVTPDAPASPTPTPTISPPTPTPAARATPTPISPTSQTARTWAVVEGVDEGVFDVVVSIQVAKVGLSGVDVKVRLLNPSAAVDSIAEGGALGTATLVGTENVSSDGSSASVAYARRGATPIGDVEGEIAVVRVLADDADLIRNTMIVTVEWTDAGLKLHGPVDAPLD